MLTLLVPVSTNRPRLGRLIALVAVAVLAGAAAALWFLAPDVFSRREIADASVFAYDTAAPLEATRTRLDDTSRTRVWRVVYRSDDGLVPAILTLPKTGNGPFPCAVVQGGLGSHKESFRRGGLTPLGVGTFTIDARFQGERGSREAALAAARDPERFASMLRGTVIDLRRGLDWLQEQRECRFARIGYVGFSFGGLVGSLLAGVDDRIAAPALIMAGADWTAVASGISGVLKMSDAERRAAVDELERVDPKHWVGRISPRPVLMINGTEDPIIVPAAARALHAAAREPKEVIWVETGHFFRPDHPDTAAVFGDLLEWMHDHLVGGRSTDP